MKIFKSFNFSFVIGEINLNFLRDLGYNNIYFLNLNEEPDKLNLLYYENLNYDLIVINNWASQQIKWQLIKGSKAFLSNKLLDNMLFFSKQKIRLNCSKIPIITSFEDLLEEFKKKNFKQFWKSWILYFQKLKSAYLLFKNYNFCSTEMDSVGIKLLISNSFKEEDFLLTPKIFWDKMQTWYLKK